MIELQETIAWCPETPQDESGALFPTPRQCARYLENVLSKTTYGELERKDAVRAILTDIRHYCDHQGINFYSSMMQSYEVYLEEKQEAKKIV